VGRTAAGETAVADSQRTGLAVVLGKTASENPQTKQQSKQNIL